MLTPSDNKALEASSSQPLPPYTDFKMDDAAIGAAYQTACRFSFSEPTGSPKTNQRFL